ncbi:hypothetical protein CYMTET_33909 [Cymbomonas tetramitiformis]|uniref:Uncharacterized protein n=1 Tax=Cymbomonas tetramitiformis TaxID=36881 RepID=A0AAE0FCR9_9CHLO|nr:hypothetical protein CYMTET_33909 [Cymbomonas tetramitiformis]
MPFTFLFRSNLAERIARYSPKPAQSTVAQQTKAALARRAVQSRAAATACSFRDRSPLLRDYAPRLERGAFTDALVASLRRVRPNTPRDVSNSPFACKFLSSRLLARTTCCITPGSSLGPRDFCTAPHTYGCVLRPKSSQALANCRTSPLFLKVFPVVAFGLFASSGKTALYDAWVNQGRMPVTLRPFISQLIVNHDRISKNKEPLSRSELLKQYCDKAGESVVADGVSYHTVPPPSEGGMPVVPSKGAPKSHAEFLQWYANVPATASQHTGASSNDEQTIPHFHSYAFGVSGAAQYARGISTRGAFSASAAGQWDEVADMDTDYADSGAGVALSQEYGCPAVMGRRRRICLEMAAMSTALVNHRPSGDVVDTFCLGCLPDHPALLPGVPIGSPGRAGQARPPRIGHLCTTRARDRHGLPTCCMSCRANSDNWEPVFDVVDLVSDSNDDGYDSEVQSHWSYDTPSSAYDGLSTEPSSPETPVSCHASYMARSMVNHQPIPASFRRVPLEEPVGIVDPAVAVAVRGRVQPSCEEDAAASLVLMSKDGWVEEDYDDHVASLSVMTSPATHCSDQVPGAELQRLTAKAAEDMNPTVIPWFRKESICYTLCNDNPKKSILVMNQKTGHYKVFKVMIVDTGSMLFVMNRKHVAALGISTQPGQATVDTSLGSKEGQRHTQWGAGELMLVVAPGTSSELTVLADVTGISPEAHVNFDVLLSVDILHAMSAGVMPATPQREAALVYHPRNQQGDFATKAYLPLRTLKVNGPSAQSSFMTQLVGPRCGSPTAPTMRELTTQEKELSMALLRVRSARPWNGSMVAVEESPKQSKEGLDFWGYQNLYVDSSGYARLCRKLSVAFDKNEPMEVEFLRCGSRKTVCTKALGWPDPTMVDRPDLEMREFCVRPLAVQPQMDRVTTPESLCSLYQWLVLPHFYEERGQFHRQLLGNLVKVNVTEMRASLHDHWLASAMRVPPLKLVPSGGKANVTRTMLRLTAERAKVTPPLS